MRRISGVRDIERAAMTDASNRSRTHRHLQIEGHQDRLEGRPPQRVRPRVPARQMPLRQLHRRARHGLRRRTLAAAARIPFQMYKPGLKMLNVEPVGNYAIRINWSDGHRAESTPTIISARSAPAGMQCRRPDQAGSSSRMRVLRLSGQPKRVT